MLPKIIITLVVLAAVAGLTYKALNPSNYQHPLHRK